MLAMEIETLAWAHPVVRDWFVGKFGSATEPQIEGWPEILAGRSVLISAPTGSGKTLAAFLACLDRLVRKALDGKLADATEVVYVSPLKALSNDVQKNLETPLSEIMQLARERGLFPQDIRVAVRTGDTDQAARRAMLRRPPHILVTTPESLYILVTAEKSRKILQDVSTVIVDEIHAIADDKRGSHLALTLERLEAILAAPAVRVGLSATQNPIEEVARFLVGSRRDLPRIISISARKNLDLEICVPDTPLGAVASGEMWDSIYNTICRFTETHRSILVFVNTRRLAERIAHSLSERLGENNVGTHHGSLSKEIRLEAEQKLKRGEYKLLVATASLELGIDIGTIDLVCQIGSPRSIAVALQRVGRAGHWRGAIPKGRLFATTRDELIECGAVVRAIRCGDLDRLHIPDCCQDVLAQQIVAAAASDEWSENELFELVTGAYPYRNLSRQQFDKLLNLLSEGIAGRKVSYGRFLHHDRINGRLKGRRGSRMIAITNGGAIPDNALFTVLAEPEEIVVGTLDEDFAIESSRGDIILLGNTSWRVRRVEGLAGKVRVEDAKGAPPTVPFWRGEAPARTRELSEYVSDLRETVSNSLSAGETLSSEAQAENEIASDSSTSICMKNSIAFLVSECGMDENSARQVSEYIAKGRSVLGTIPTCKRVVAERFFDEGGGMQLVIHAPFGGRINRAWGMALRKKFCRNFNIELQASATDDGINISLTDQHSFPLADVFHFVHPNSLQHTLEQTALQSPLFTVRWRWDANRSLALLRFSSGKKVPPQIQRMRAEDLLAAVFPQAAACQDNIVGEIDIPDHPLVNEVMKDVLTEAMDMEGFSRVLEDILSGTIECVAVDTPVPSEFSHEILNANPYAYLDDAPLEERRARAVEMRRILPDSMQDDVGQLDRDAIEKVILEAVPDIRDSDELYDLLMSLVFLPSCFNWAGGGSVENRWLDFFVDLSRSRRAKSVKQEITGETIWLAAEREDDFALLKSETANLTSEQQHRRQEVLEQSIAGWMRHLGPVRIEDLCAITGLEPSDIEQALIGLETRGVVLRGRFDASASGIETGLSWCDRVLLARIHRLTIGILRKQVEAVSAAQFMRWLIDWQHAAPGSQLAGERGLYEVVRQLAGFELQASAWEAHILPGRIRNYKSTDLDNLCMTGSVAWARFSRIAPSGSSSGSLDGSRRRIYPTRLSPVCLYAREEQDWIERSRAEIEDEMLSSQAARVRRCLQEQGASFFQDIVRLSGYLKSEVESALWELVAAGLVTADSFDNLRSLIDPKRRSGQGRYRNSGRPRHSQGRWSLIISGAGSSAEDSEISNSTRVEAASRLLLERYGVIFRELLLRESNIPPWRELVLFLRRMEARGEIRGGRFVGGFVGEQFALPHAVESLRARKGFVSSDRSIVNIAACDPLNLVGFVLPGERIPSNSGEILQFQDGVFLGTR